MLVLVVLLEQINWTIRRAEVPAYPWSALHVPVEGVVKELAEDHILNAGDLHEDNAGESMLKGHASQSVIRSAINDALEDMILLESNRHEQPLFRWSAR